MGVTEIYYYSERKQNLCGSCLSD